MENAINYNKYILPNKRLNYGIPSSLAFQRLYCSLFTTAFIALPAKQLYYLHYVKANFQRA